MTRAGSLRPACFFVILAKGMLKAVSTRIARILSRFKLRISHISFKLWHHKLIWDRWHYEQLNPIICRKGVALSISFLHCRTFSASASVIFRASSDESFESSSSQSRGALAIGSIQKEALVDWETGHHSEHPKRVP